MPVRLVAVLILLFASGQLHAETLTVATKKAPPFVMQDEDGNWHGISIDLWELIAAELEVEPTYVELSLTDIIDGIAESRYDIAVGAITATTKREQRLDFTHTFHSTGLGAATTVSNSNPWLAVAANMFSLRFLSVILALIGVLLVTGAAVWLFERKRNAEEFGGSILSGLGQAFWWSAVTMTTVGYGDKSPKTPGGRAVALLWMFVSVIIISSFTAAIATSLTIGSLSQGISDPDDLPSAKVAVVENSTAAQWASVQLRRVYTVETLPEALDQLAAGEVSAVVHDAPLLRWLVSRHEAALTVLPQTFQRQDYAFAVPPGSELREKVNRILLNRINDGSVAAIVRRYLGDQ